MTQLRDVIAPKIGTETTPWLLQCANLSRHDPLSSARNRCTMTDYHNPAWTKESRFRGSLDDVIIIPLVVVALAANKILAFHPFNPDAAARLRLPFGNADRLASALRG